MKKRLLPILLLLSLMFGFIAHAQEQAVPNPNAQWADVELPNLMFTEFRLGTSSTGYFEITNMDDVAVDLNDFTVFSVYWTSYTQYNPEQRWYVKPDRFVTLSPNDTILPGETKVFAHVYEEQDTLELSANNLNMFKEIDYPIFRGDSMGNPDLLFAHNPELYDFYNDSVFMSTAGNQNFIFRVGGKQQFHLRYYYEYVDTAGADTTGIIDTISTYITLDVVNVYVDDFTTYAVPNDASGDVAGVDNACGTHTLIRKINDPSSGTKKVYPTANWIAESRGTSVDDSQWWIVPSGAGNIVYSTVGNYGDYSISFTAKAGTTAEVDDANKTISVAWESLRGEPVLDDNLDFGDGMAWIYIKDTIENVDSAYTRVRDGDLLEVYAFGLDVEAETYTFKVLDAVSDLAIARSKIATWPAGNYRTNSYFNITEGIEGMDSILNLKNQLRVDTLFKYVEIPPLATSEIVFVDGDDTRIDLLDGDILKVIAEDGTTTKEYYLQVNDYVASNSTALSTITWPDYDQDWFFDWESDEIPGFTSAQQNYTLLLPDYQTTVPALMAKASDLNAKVVIDRATALVGTPEQRTSTITVYSETSDTIFTQFTVTFSLDIDIQLSDAEPFISEVLYGRYNGDNYIEIFNPNDGVDALDMSKYLVLSATVGADPVTAITNYTSYFNTAVDGVLPDATDSEVHKFYVPGYKFNYNTNDSEDPADYTWKNEVQGGITKDVNVDPFVAPGDVFLISAFDQTIASEAASFQGDSTYKFVDVNLFANEDFPNAVKGACVAKIQLYHRLAAQTKDALFFYKILNDSITNGTKGLWESADDYQLIDRVQMDQSQTSVGGFGYPGNRTVLVRKPYVQEGNLELYGGFDVSPDTCDWTLYGFRIAAPNKLGKTAMGNYLGYHLMDPITSHLSTVTSDVYAVDLGFSGQSLRIVGDMSTHSVDAFVNNLNKSDSMQMITVIKGDTPKDSADLVETGDVVMVMSADSTNTTYYTTEARLLSSNTDLESVPDMGITVSIPNLTITGFDYSKAILDVLAGVTAVDDLSIINVIDNSNQLVALLTQSLDTNLVEEMVATKVYDGLQFEVVAEDGSIALYSLQADMASSDAYITSNVFTVADDPKSVTGVANGYSVSTFMSQLFPSSNATMYLKNKAGAIRADGLLQFDDFVEVISEDASVTAKYFINFYGENNPDVPAGVQEMGANSLIELFPNPTSSILNISNAKAGSVVQVISLGGSLVYTNTVSTENFTIDMSSMNTGIYLVRLVDKNSSTVRRVLKK